MRVKFSQTYKKNNRFIWDRLFSSSSLTNTDRNTVIRRYKLSVLWIQPIMRLNNDETLKDALQRFSNDRQFKTKLRQAKINSLWPELMGSAIANYTSEIVVRNRILYLRINSSSLKQELTYGKEKILNLINEELGEEFLKDVIIR